VPSAAPERGLAGALLRHRDYGDSPLPTGASILDVFDDMQRELLILGEPGAGKTILLLQLARRLIERARQDADEPVPVMLKLSSWTADKPLPDWLADEVRRQYRMPNASTVAWFERQQVTLLLDGLDEVAEPQRAACAEAINRFRQQYPALDLAVTSRQKDYELLTNILNLRVALLLPA
jgi:predicted NACHT family NTPase